ncbi:MAG: hypothetical protein KC420_15510 [Myxococcales bacterium]|nr:hypothetical protein [Myxococcales bacterium]
MITTLATLLIILGETAAPPPPAEPVDVASSEDAEAPPSEAPPSETADAPPEAAPAEEDEPWVIPPPEEPQVPPTSAAVERQGNPELTEALNAPKKRGYAQYESPQNFAAEIKFGPYLPDVDRRYNGPDEFGPYAKIFGETDDRGVTTGAPKKLMMTAVAFEWQFLNPGGIGPLGFGYTFSFARDKAQALLADPPATGSVRSEADSTVFWVMPMALQLVYRFELLADRVHIPIVPYVKGGLAWSLWWSKNGDGKLSRNSMGEKALGGVWGWQLNAGGMLRLDFLEVGSSRTLDRTTGINHTYLFGEYQLSRIDNFGRENAMSLGSSTWLLGLAIEF